MLLSPSVCSCHLPTRFGMNLTFCPLPKRMNFLKTLHPDWEPVSASDYGECNVCNVDYSVSKEEEADLKKQLTKERVRLHFSCCHRPSPDFLSNLERIEIPGQSSPALWRKFLHSNGFVHDPTM